MTRAFFHLGLPAAVLAIVLAGCLGKESVAGGASGIENPEIVLAFQGENGPVAVTGSLRVYQERANWLDSSFFTRTLNDQDTAIITALDFQALPGIRVLDSLPSDSSLGFNFVASGKDVEGILGGFRVKGNSTRGYVFEKSPNGIGNLRKASAGGTGTDGVVLKADLPVRPPVWLYPGKIAQADLAKAISVVFVPGSPYFTYVTTTGLMVFPVLPQGTFPVRAASLPFDNSQAIKFYCTRDSLSTSRPFAPETWEDCPD